MMVDEAFVQLHPGVLDMAQDNIVQISPTEHEEPLINEVLDQLTEKSNVFTYPANEVQDSSQNNPKLEALFVEALHNAL
jgi:hypothetical protein